MVSQNFSLDRTARLQPPGMSGGPARGVPPLQTGTQVVLPEWEQLLSVRLRL